MKRPSMFIPRRSSEIDTSQALLKKHLTSMAVLFATLVLSACTSTSIPVAEPDSRAQQAAPLSEYYVGVGDVLNVNVWRNPELSITVPVRPDGRISVPLAGDIDASGDTPERVAENITESLSAFIRDPQVSVIVTGINSGDFLTRVRVTGAVQAPRSLPHRQGMTVLDLVLEAGGISEFANLREVNLYRGSETFPIALDDILNRGKLSTNYELHPGDVLTIGERRF